MEETGGDINDYVRLNQDYGKLNDNDVLYEYYKQTGDYMAFISVQALAERNQMTVADAKSGLIKLLDDATRIRMRSDANYGAFLSGGLDSSSVVGLMSMYSSDPIKTFSIGFEDLRFDESKYAVELSLLHEH